ncbi:MAG TPA: ABC transporter ATP-binding protein [Thermoleophilaceae bacterium]|jgi:branched-chain amino acid transport system ATP-binding protein|nr:ABC transporter ATP-binding protein [Thermoleophilaceae bacterium]
MTELPMLEVEGLNGYYGSAHVLQGVSFKMDDDRVAVIGRNGMGKSTLCAALTGLLDKMDGSIRFGGRELMGTPAYKIAAAGIGFVPQGRRLFPSLSVDEHMRLVAGRSNGEGWTPKRIYELFPRLAERKRNGAAQLSGGEQQMLAIARALLLNPKLLIMDEPSEGLAPAVVESLIETIRSLADEGTALLVVEQKLGVATALADRQLVMVGGRIAAETTAHELENDPDAQRRYLGVEPLATEE